MREREREREREPERRLIHLSDLNDIQVSQPLHPGGQAYPGGDGEVTMSGAIGV